MGKKLTIDDFIRKSKEVHGDKYDYSLVDYVNNDKKVSIRCLVHGIFEQSPGEHMRGQNCPKCRINYRKPDKNFIEKSKKKHGNKYDYSLVEYKGNKHIVKIICSIHGIFEQQPANHTKGCICPYCNDEMKSERFSMGKEEFVKKANNKHSNKYDYSLSNYINNKSKIDIICPIHGTFPQKPDSHLSGAGCPKCKDSRGEKMIREILNNNNVEYISQKTFNGCEFLLPLKFDFYLPELNLCIEFDGEQHYKRFHFENNDDNLNIRKIRDSIKNKFCKDNNINLLRIKYNENITNKLNNLIKKQKINYVVN